MRLKVLSQEIVRFKSDFEGHAKMTYFDIKYGQYAKSFEDIRWVLSLVERIFRELNDETISGLFDSENILLDRGEIGNAVNLNFYERRVYESFSFHDSFIEFIHQVWDLSDEANNYKIKEAVYHLMSQYMFSSFSRDKTLLISFLRKFLYSIYHGRKNYDKVENFSYYIFDTAFHVVYSKETEISFVTDLNVELFNYFRFLIDIDNVKPIREFYKSVVERNVLFPINVLERNKNFEMNQVNKRIILAADIFIRDHRYLGMPLSLSEYDELKKKFNYIISQGSDDLISFYSDYYDELIYKFKLNSFVELVVVVMAYSINHDNLDLVKWMLNFNQPKKNFSTFSNPSRIPVRTPSWHIFVSKIGEIIQKFTWMWKDHEDPDYDVYLLFVIFYIRLMDFEHWDEGNIKRILGYGTEIFNETELLAFESNLKKLVRVAKENVKYLKENFGVSDEEIESLIKGFEEL